MPIMPWNSKFDLGVPEMNAEHKGLLDLMNKIYDMNEAGASHGQLVLAINELGALTKKHFADEERYMESIGYPKLVPHQMIHRDLLRELGDNIAQFKASSGPAPKELFRFLKIWLTAHIAGIDRQYADHAKTAPKAA